MGFGTHSTGVWIQGANTGVSYANLALNPNGGYVGIGTTSPTAALDVVGTIKASTNVHAPAFRHGTTGGGVLIQNTQNFSAAGISVAILQSSTFSNASGTMVGVAIQPTYNQSGAAAATDLLINRAETAVGSGAQQLIDAQVGGVSKFSVRNDGAVSASGDITAKAGAASRITLDTVTLAGWGSLFLRQMTPSTTNYSISSNGTALAINRPTGGDLDFRENNVAQVTLKTGGNVGIGTAAPGQKLTVAEGHIRVEGSAAYGAQFYRSGTFIGSITSASNMLSFQTANDAGFQFLNSAAAATVTIAGDGKVGIGTPTPQGPLHVSSQNGKNRIESSWAIPILDWYPAGGSTNSRNWRIAANYSANGTFEILRGTTLTGEPTTPVLAADYNGNVGIGTTAPKAKLHANQVSTGSFVLGEGVTNHLTNIGAVISNDTAGAVGSAGVSQAALVNTRAPTVGNAISLGFIGAGRTASDLIEYWKIGAVVTAIDPTSNNQAADLVFMTKAVGSYPNAAAERVRVTNAGNVGIGTATPQRPLDISVGGTTYGQGGYSGQTAAIFRSTLSASSNSRVSITSGNTGVSIIDFGDTDGDRGSLQYLHNGDAFAISVNAAERIRIDATGNVGIGTTTPSAKLDVNSDTVRLRTARTPASASAAGNAGDICWDADYVYVCVATNTWKRSALSTW